MMKEIFLAALGWLIAADLASGADSTLSRDCTHLFLVQDGQSALTDIDLRKKTSRNVDLTQPCNEPIRGVTLSASGFVLCATKHAIWAFDPSSGKCVKVSDAPDDVTQYEIACNPTTGEILTNGIFKQEDEAAHKRVTNILTKDGKWHPVYSRYGTWMGDPVFGSDDTLFFEDNGDLWAGFIETDTDNDGGPDKTLVAYRCAPLASLVEENTSPPSTGFVSIAVLQHTVYACDARMGGSGWGSVIRFKRPPVFVVSGGEREISGLDWKGLAGLCASVEEIADDPCASLCSSPAHSLVVFTKPHSNEVFLVRHDGKPVSETIKGWPGVDR